MSKKDPDMLPAVGFIYKTVWLALKRLAEGKKNEVLGRSQGEPDQHIVVGVVKMEE